MKKVVKDDSSKKRILDAATRLFAQKGFDGVSVREICKEADANICMISYYWGGKQDLYKGIIEDLIERQTAYIKSFLNFEKSPAELPKSEQILLLKTIVGKGVDFLYSGNISKDLVLFLIKWQQATEFFAGAPVFNYLAQLIACIFEKDINDREVIFKTLFIIAQINSPKILPVFSLRRLGQEDFVQEDIKIIKENVIFYIDAILKEAKID